MTNKTDGFYTMKGYQLNEEIGLTSAMEDYLEMICRILKKNNKVSVSELSVMLHVKPSSVSKMIQHLNSSGYIQAEKYGVISITKKGEAVGNYLLYRHNVIHKFLCVLNHSENELEETEKIEHFLSRTTVENLNKLTQLMINNKKKIMKTD